MLPCIVAICRFSDIGSAEVSIEVSCDTSIQSNLAGVTFWEEQLLVAVVFLSDNHTSSE